MSLVEFLARGEEPDGYLEGAPLCPVCLSLTDPAWISPTYHVRNRHHSVTAESGLTLVSQRFVDAVGDAGGLGVRFVSLPADSEYYGLVVEQVLTVDRSWGKLTFDGPVCSRCGRQSTFGRAKRFLDADVDDLRGFARSDIEYGGMANRPTGQQPTTYVDANLGTTLRSLKLCQFRPLPS